MRRFLDDIPRDAIRCLASRWRIYAGAMLRDIRDAHRTNNRREYRRHRDATRDLCIVETRSTALNRANTVGVTAMTTIARVSTLPAHARSRARLTFRRA